MDAKTFYRPKSLTVEARHYPEAATLKLGALSIDIPAGHTVVYYPGGVCVTPTEDFEALWLSGQGGPVPRTYG